RSFYHIHDEIDILHVYAPNLYAHQALDTGREHVDAVADRRHPDVREPRHLDYAVELIHEFFRRHSRPPFPARLQLDRGLVHLERRRIGRRLGTYRLAEHARHFSHGLDETVGLLQKLRRLARRKSGQRRRHVEQIAFVERRHKLAAEPVHGPERRDKDRNGDEQDHFRAAQRAFEQRAIERDKETVERIFFLSRNAPADEITHQHRNQRARKARSRGHRISLGEGERREKPP